MRLLALLALVAACASPKPAVPADGPATVEGAILSVDLGPMAYDDDAILLIQTAEGQATVHVPARTNLCEAHGLGRIGSLQAGDVVEVRGERGDDGVVTPCTSTDHQILLRSAVSAGVYRGVYEAGFEMSVFHPCESPDEAWWLSRNADFNAQFSAIETERGVRDGSGRRVFVEVTVVGELQSREEGYGHLGAYPHQLDVRETRDMVFRALNPVDDVPACRS